jgi:hypothetical protein
LQLAGRSPSEAILDAELQTTDMAAFAGIGVAMTANMLQCWARSIGVDPSELWRLICEKGPSMGLPGMGL